MTSPEGSERGLRSSWKELPRPPRSWVEAPESGDLPATACDSRHSQSSRRSLSSEESAGPLQPCDDDEDNDSSIPPPTPNWSTQTVVTGSRNVSHDETTSAALLRRYGTLDDLGQRELDLKVEKPPPVGSHTARAMKRYGTMAPLGTVPAPDFADPSAAARRRDSLTSISPGLGDVPVSSDIGDFNLNSHADFDQDVDRLVQERLVNNHRHRCNMNQRLYKNTEYNRSCPGKVEDAARGFGWDLVKLLGCGPRGMKESCLLDCSRSVVGCVETGDCGGACSKRTQHSRSAEQPAGHSRSRTMPEEAQSGQLGRSHTAMLIDGGRSSHRHHTALLPQGGLIPDDGEDEDDAPRRFHTALVPEQPSIRRRSHTSVLPEG